MRAVWSFWSKPFHAYYGGIWCKPLHHLLAWGLSVRTASRHYPETVLITDRPGKKLLVDQLGLHFSEVLTELEQLNDVGPRLVGLGEAGCLQPSGSPFSALGCGRFLVEAIAEPPPRGSRFYAEPGGISCPRSSLSSPGYRVGVRSTVHETTHGMGMGEVESQLLPGRKLRGHRRFTR